MSFEVKVEHKTRLVEYNLSDVDKLIIINCFKNDGKMRAPTKSKIWYLLSGNKIFLTYSEIRMILKYIEPIYQYDVEFRLKNGKWWNGNEERFKQLFGIKDDEKASVIEFRDKVDKNKEKRNPSQIRTQEMIQQIIDDIHKQQEFTLPEECQIHVKEENNNVNDDVNYMDDSLMSLSPIYISDDEYDMSNNSHCLIL